VFLVLLRGDGAQVLCGLRADGVYAAGQWNLPSGKLHLRPGDAHPAGVVHICPAGGQPRVGFVFVAEHDRDRHGEPRNTEPDKCDRLAWYDLPALPGPVRALQPSRA
jgi:hypothetical protein